MTKYTVSIENYDGKIRPFVGKYLIPDGWRGQGSKIVDSSEYDKTYFGFDVLRLPSGHYENVSSAVRVRVTSRLVTVVDGFSKVRCEIEWLKDGEDSEFSHGWLFID